MAKKVRRARSTKPVKTAETAGESTAVAAPTKLTEAEEFRQEYAYVLKDLRRMFILAAIMFALLIAINLLYPLFQ